MRAFPLLFALVVAGCVKPNEAPISFGVPDGFVIARDIIPTDQKDVRVERVTYAFHDHAYHASLSWPLKPRGPIAAIDGTQNPALDAAQAASTGALVVSGTDPGRAEMVGTLEGVIRP